MVSAKKNKSKKIWGQQVEARFWFLREVGF